jgi:hypothetical protein
MKWKKLLSYGKVPKYVAMFPVTSLDSLRANTDEIFFLTNTQPISADVLTNYLREFRKSVQ